MPDYWTALHGPALVGIFRPELAALFHNSFWLQVLASSSVRWNERTSHAGSVRRGICRGSAKWCKGHQPYVWNDSFLENQLSAILTHSAASRCEDGTTWLRLLRISLFRDPGLFFCDRMLRLSGPLFGRGAVCAAQRPSILARSSRTACIFLKLKRYNALSC